VVNDMNRDTCQGILADEHACRNLDAGKDCQMV
jgi:hypothetical protein